MIAKRRTSLAAVGILVATSAFLVIVIWLHAVRPDVDRLHRGVSRYAAGDHGYAVSVAFSMLALALVLAASQLGNQTEAQNHGLNRGSFWVAASGLLLVVLFPLRSPSPGRVEYIAHQLGGAVFFLAATIGVQAISPTLRRTAAPTWLESVARVSGAVAVIALLLFFADVVVRASPLHSVTGALQRACFVALSTSLATLGLGVLSGRRPPDQALQPTSARADEQTGL